MENGTPRNVDKMFGILHDAGQYNEDQKLLQTLAEAREALTCEGELMTAGQLAELMGIAPDESGQIPFVPFMNACMSVHSFEGVQALPSEERVRAMRTAFEYLSQI